jgi:hypothetical protein
MHHHEVKSLIVGEKFVEAEALISHSLRVRTQMLGHVHFKLFILSLSCLFNQLFSSVADLYFGTVPDPDLRIRASD